MRKKSRTVFFTSIFVLISFISIGSTPVWASITGRNYGLTPGKMIYWNNEWYYIRSHWDVYFNSFSDNQGTAMNFSKTNLSKDNGYLVVGRDQWDDWVAAFGADYNEVHSLIQYSTVKTSVGDIDFAWLSQIANVCGWRVKNWALSGDSGWAIYEPIPPEQPQPPPEPLNNPPTARFSMTSSAYEGDTVTIMDNSFDSDGEIVDWEWSFIPVSGISGSLGDTGGQLVFSTAGSYNLTLTVTDDDGETDSTSKSITIKQPKPAAVITIKGTLKANRKVILDSGNSSTPSSYPIDHSLDEWTIIPISVGSEPDIKIGPQYGSIQEVLFKKPGTYTVGLRVHNVKHHSDWVYKYIIISPDDPPAANFTVPPITFRSPSDQSFASITISDRSFSLDGDNIIRRIWKYRFDSNNDGSFHDESWVDLDIGNNISPVLRTDKVGKYQFSLSVQEGFGQETIPQFITETDYKTADTSAKPDSEKVTEVKNIAPFTSFTATAKPKADLVFASGNTDSAKTANIAADINSYILPKLNGGNIDSIVTIIDAGSINNTLHDPSIENTSYVNYNSQPWRLEYNGRGYAFRTGPTVDTTVKHTGSKSFRFLARGSTVGVAQYIPGYKPGDTLTISAWVNVTDYSRGTIQIDILSEGSVWFDSAGASINKKTNGWVKIDATTTIPAGVDTNILAVRIFADGSPAATFYVDDIEVGKKTSKSIDQVLNEVSWRNNTNRFLINVSDTPDFSNTSGKNDFASKLKSGNINYSVLGTDANRTEAQDIIVLNSNNGTFYYNLNMVTALDSLGTYIASKATFDAGPEVKYLLLEEVIQCTPYYSDYENDPKLTDHWYYSHDPGYVDNNTGLSFYHQKTLTGPVGSFDKCGKYDITYKAMDDPVKGNLSFLNYRLWSEPTPISIIVHRKPVANFEVTPGSLNITDLSYDPDFQYKRLDKGITEWSWKWKEINSATWNIGKPSGIIQLGTYVIRLEVKDIFGAWSYPVEKTISVTNLQRPPVVDFNWSPALVYEGDKVTLNNLSSDPDGDPLTYQWTVFDPLGVTTQYGTNNIIIDKVSPGIYWVTLRAWDTHANTDVVTKSISINNLSINGHVSHTPEWNSNRINYNLTVSGTEDSPRPYNFYWAGENFIINADTTNTGSSATKAESVTVELLSTGTEVSLQPYNGNTRWSGEMWQPNFEELPDGPHTFRFTVTYSNGAVKTDDETVFIEGSWQDYFNFHRSW